MKNLHVWVPAAVLDAHPNRLDARFPSTRTALRPRRWPSWVLDNYRPIIGLLLLQHAIDCRPLCLNPSPPGCHDHSNAIRFAIRLSICAFAHRAHFPCWNILSNEVALVAYYESKTSAIWKHLNRAMSPNEEVNIPDGECIFSEVVKLWWLTEKPRGDLSSGVSKFAQQICQHPPSSVLFSCKSFWLLDIIFSPLYNGEVYFSGYIMNLVNTVTFYFDLTFYCVKLEFLSLNTSTNPSPRPDDTGRSSFSCRRKTFSV